MKRVSLRLGKRVLCQGMPLLGAVKIPMAAVRAIREGHSPSVHTSLSGETFQRVEIAPIGKYDELDYRSFIFNIDTSSIPPGEYKISLAEIDFQGAALIESDLCIVGSDEYEQMFREQCDEEFEEQPRIARTDIKAFVRRKLIAFGDGVQSDHSAHYSENSLRTATTLLINIENGDSLPISKLNFALDALLSDFMYLDILKQPSSTKILKITVTRDGLFTLVTEARLMIPVSFQLGTGFSQWSEIAQLGQHKGDIFRSEIDLTTGNNDFRIGVDAYELPIQESVIVQEETGFATVYEAAEPWVASELEAGTVERELQEAEGEADE
jgi:hypothetical protein